MDSSFFCENPSLSRSDLRQIEIPLASSDPSVPLFNLSIIDHRIDSLRRFLSKSLETHASIGDEQIDLVSKEISSSIRQIILNGAALLTASQKQNLESDLGAPTVPIAENTSQLMDLKSPTVKASKSSDLRDPVRKSPNLADLELPSCSQIPATLRNPVDLRIPSAEENIADLRLPFCSDSRNPASGDGNLVDLKLPEKSTNSRKLRNPANSDRKDDDIVDTDTEIIELDSVELLAEHIHFCEICGKGFKRDANLRMHKRAHGNRFKTLEALSKPERCDEDRGRKVRFSCPFAGCNRNQSHKRFRPLKSAICVKNHFKRSHCPKMYFCNRCNKKSFSVVSDLKSHLKHCGESRWRCSCGTSFSRKDKLFGHVALFEGHMPAVVGEEKSMGADLEGEMQLDEEEHIETADAEVSDSGFLEGLFDGFGAMDGGSFDDLLGFL